MVGFKAGRLTVVKSSTSRMLGGKECVMWECYCSCGKTIDVMGQSIRSGNTTSCGCLRNEVVSKTHKLHGLTDSKTYNAWAAARSRCTNKNNPRYQDYGGRGIFMCEEWMSSFQIFFSDMGEAPIGLSLERKDNDGPYCKSNCTWATRSEQMKNRRYHGRL